MLNMTQLQTILLYPIRDSAARKNFLIASVLMFANFIIPIAPMLLLMGYVARIMRQIMDEKREPSMPEWDDWSTFLTDGLRMWGFRMVVMLPLMLLMFGGMGLYFISIFAGVATARSSHMSSPLFLAGLAIFMITMAIFIVLSIPAGVISMVGSAHVVAKKSFSAGFAFKEWWQIFRKNIGTFILYYVIAMAISFVLMIILQILYFTIIFICLLPFVFPVIMAYMILIQDALFAYAYTQGRDMLIATNLDMIEPVTQSV
jgi:hypothetical protein